MIEIKNARIESVTLGVDRCLSAWLHLEFGDSSAQSFGGYVLYHVKQRGNYAGLFILRCLEVVGVNNWEALRGKTVRVKIDSGHIVSIGNILTDEWFTPHEEFEALRKTVDGL